MRASHGRTSFRMNSAAVRPNIRCSSDRSFAREDVVGADAVGEELTAGNRLLG
jgi:hypothetical protein